MNTNQNKSRIIEDGWMNVLTNVFGTGHRHLVVIGQQMQNKRQSIVEPFLPAPRDKSPMMSKYVVKPCSRKVPVLSDNLTSTRKKANDIEIFTIFVRYSLMQILVVILTKGHILYPSTIL